MQLNDRCSIDQRPEIAIATFLSDARGVSACGADRRLSMMKIAAVVCAAKAVMRRARQTFLQKVRLVTRILAEQVLLIIRVLKATFWKSNGAKLAMLAAHIG